MPSASSCLLHVFGFAEYPYQKESKRDKNGRKIILEYLGFLESKINARRCPRGPRGRGRAPDPRGPPVRRLMPFFRRMKANIWIEIVLKFQPNRSYGSPGI